MLSSRFFTAYWPRQAHVRGLGARVSPLVSAMRTIRRRIHQVEMHGHGVIVRRRGRIAALRRVKRVGAVTADNGGMPRRIQKQAQPPASRPFPLARGRRRRRALQPLFTPCAGAGAAAVRRGRRRHPGARDRARPAPRPHRRLLHLRVPGLAPGQLYAWRAQARSTRPAGCASTPTRCCSTLRPRRRDARRLQPQCSRVAGRQPRDGLQERRDRHQRYDWRVNHPLAGRSPRP